MATFNALVRQTIQFEIDIEREVKLNVLKKDIVENGYCSAVEDGDASGWYDYIENYVIDNGGTINFTNEKNEDDIREALEKPLRNLSHIENIGAVKSDVIREDILEIEKE